jgi:hypothetical protein
MNWVIQKKLGYFINKKISAQVRYAAICQSKVFQFAKTINQETIDQLKRERGRKAKIKNVVELGRGLELPPEYSPPRSFDPKDKCQQYLIEQIRRSLDNCSMRALKQNAMKITTSVATLKNLIRRAEWREMEALCGIASGYMFFCAKPYDGIDYVGIGGTNFLHALKCLSGFIPWEKYLRPGDILFNGESGKTNNIRWVVTEDTSALKNEAVVFGDGGLLIMEVQTPELRFFGRTIAWYGVLSFVGQNILHIPERKKG